MKIAPRDAIAFVKRPDPAARAVLVYGPDAGLVAERAQALCKTVVDDLADPFAVAALTGDILADDPARLADEAAAIPMLGGARLVRVAGAADGAAPALKAYLANPSPHALVVLEAGDLGPRSPLRKLAEGADNAAALACYVEEGWDLSRTIGDLLTAHGVRATSDAAAWLAQALAGDRGKLRAGLEKLALHHGGDPAPIGLAEAQAVCGEVAEAALDDLAYAVTARRAADALAAHARLVAEGVADVMICRTLAAHFRRLHLARARADGGESVDSVVKSMRIFFRQAPAFRAAVAAWPLPRLARALARVTELEARCKSSGQAAGPLLTAQVLLGLAR
jgi:DNA polymerase III subunit delta